MPPLYGSCPGCGARRPIEDYLLDPEARQALATLCQRLADWPAIVSRVPVYLSLHAPAQNAMAWSKCNRLISELSDLLTTGTVTHDGQTRPCTPDIWATAIDAARDQHRAGKLTLPLGDGHGWLRKVTFDLAGKAQAKTAADRAARERGETPIGYSPAHEPAPATDRPTQGSTLKDEIREKAGELAALSRLEQGTPGVHAARISNLKTQLANLRSAL